MLALNHRRDENRPGDTIESLIERGWGRLPHAAAADDGAEDDEADAVERRVENPTITAEVLITSAMIDLS